MIAAALELALLIFLTAGALDVIAGPSRRSLRTIPYVLGAIGSALNIASAIGVLTNGTVDVNLGSLFGIGTTTLTIDRLSALFLVWLFSLAFMLSIFSAQWIQKESSPRRRGLASGYLLIFAALTVILTAGDAFTFIFAWESLTLSFYLLTSLSRRSKEQAEDSWLTLGIQKIGGASLLVGFLLLAGSSSSLQFSQWASIQVGTLHDIAYALIVIGFGAKLGIVPLQSWMPSGYSRAIGPTRAAMAGIAANAAVYGLLRFFGILGRPPVWLVIGVLLLGGATAILGIAFAGVERRLSKLIAYSSVENAGIIFTAFGVALAGAATGNEMLIALGLLATVMHSVAHSVAKSTVFTSLTSVEATNRSEDLEDIRGIARALPFSGAAFAIGSFTLAGLPPTIGFVSEWLVLESLMQEFRLAGLAIRLALLAAGALVALTSGLAALAFVRVVGFSVLGKGKREQQVQPEGLSTKLTGIVMAGSCLAMAAITPLEIRLLSFALSSLAPRLSLESSLRSPWVIQPVFPGFSILSPTWLLIYMPSLFLIVTFLAWQISGHRYFKSRRVPPWHSATAGPERSASYTTFGYANLLRHLLGNVLGTVRERNSIPFEEGPGGRQVISEIRYETRVSEPILTFVYKPISSALLFAATQIKRIQSGKLQVYVSYMFATLLIVLILIAVR